MWPTVRHGRAKAGGPQSEEIPQRKRLSQEALALECGLHRTYVSGVERGVRNPTVVVLEQLAKPLDLPTWRLLED